MPIRSAATRTVINPMSARLHNRLASYSGDWMAGVRLDHQPDLAAGPEIERGGRGRRHVDLDRHADADLQAHDCALARQRSDRSGDDVARAEAARTLGGDEDVAGPNRNADAVAGRERHQRRLEIDGGARQAYDHHAGVRTALDDRRVEEILEA